MGEGAFKLFVFGNGIMTIHDLPAVNASLNGLSAMFLTAGFVFHSPQKQIRA
jgi:hypothetical protein